jgi:hypothetical protein
VAGQGRQQAVFDRAEVDLQVALEHLPAREIDPQIAEGLDGLVYLARQGPAQGDAHPRHQLAHPERLGQVVVFRLGGDARRRPVERQTEDQFRVAVDPAHLVLLNRL